MKTAYWRKYNSVPTFSRNCAKCRKIWDKFGRIKLLIIIETTFRILSDKNIETDPEFGLLGSGGRVEGIRVKYFRVSSCSGGRVSDIYFRVNGQNFRNRKN